MYVMDRYSVKQPQNIIIKVKTKQHGIGKKESWKKVEWNIYYCLYFVCGTASCSALFTPGKAVHLTLYEFSSYLHQWQPPIVVQWLLGGLMVGLI